MDWPSVQWLCHCRWVNKQNMAAVAKNKFASLKKEEKDETGDPCPLFSGNGRRRVLSTKCSKIFVKVPKYQAALKAPLSRVYRKWVLLVVKSESESRCLWKVLLAFTSVHCVYWLAALQLPLSECKWVLVVQVWGRKLAGSFASILQKLGDIALGSVSATRKQPIETRRVLGWNPL